MTSGRPLILAALLLCGGIALAEEAGYAALRERMIRDIQEDVEATARYIDKRSLDPRVMEVMGRVPRHRFVPSDQQANAYENRPLGIGYGQTISQPYIVALMSDLLRPDPDHRVLEVGTGSGYQAAVLADLFASVYTIEIIEPLGEQARERFAALGYDSIHVRLGDGYYGWESEAPFEAIIVTAAASHVPPPLIGQLKPGGRMVIPVGSRFQVQHLMLIEKQQDGEIQTRQILPVRFVPLTGAR